MTDFVLGLRRALTPPIVSREPASPAVYVLFDTGEVIHIGGGTDARACLENHLDGVDSPCTRDATHYCVEFTPLHDARRDALLRSYVRQFNRYPRCHTQR